MRHASIVALIVALCGFAMPGDTGVEAKAPKEANAYAYLGTNCSSSVCSGGDTYFISNVVSYESDLRDGFKHEPTREWDCRNEDGTIPEYSCLNPDVQRFDSRDAAEAGRQRKIDVIETRRRGTRIVTVRLVN